MSQYIIDSANASVAGGRLTNPFVTVLLVVVLGITSACTGTGSSQPVDDQNRDKTHDKMGTVTTAGKERRERPPRPARVEIEDDVGFTVTEVVSISGQVRTDYREAVRLLAAQDYANGIKLLEQVVDKEPDATAPFVDLGIAYAHTNAFEKALESFSQALQATPDHPVAHNELGIVYRKLGRFQDARRS